MQDDRGFFADVNDAVRAHNTVLLDQINTEYHTDYSYTHRYSRSYSSYRGASDLRAKSRLSDGEVQKLAAAPTFSRYSSRMTQAVCDPYHYRVPPAAYPSYFFTYEFMKTHALVTTRVLSLIARTSDVRKCVNAERFISRM